jgi:4-alpha-glucanotransferase/alpha-amylase
MKHEISAADIEPDARPRALFVDALTHGQHDVRIPLEYQRNAAEAGPQFIAAAGESRVSKSIAINHNRLTVTYRFASPPAERFVTQLNLAMPSCDGVLGRYVHEGNIPGGFGQAIDIETSTTLALEDALLGGSLEVLCSPPAYVSGRPHLTVSQSEDGFEKIMQAVCVELSWDLLNVTEIVVALEIRRQTRA